MKQTKSGFPREASGLKRSAGGAGDRRRGAGAELLKGTVSRRVLMEALEPRLLLSADLFPIIGAISAPGDQDNYRITISEPTRVSFDSLSPAELNWRLSGADTPDITGRMDRDAGYYRSQPAVADLVRGTYTLSVFGAGAQTGEYRFEMHDLSAAAVLPLNSDHHVTLPKGNETRELTFDAREGDRFALGVTTSGTRYEGGIALVAPSGTVLQNNDLSSFNRTLTETGTYTLLIEGNPTNTVPVDLTLHMTLGQVEATAYTLGSTKTATFDTIGETHVYEFTLASNSRVEVTGTRDAAIYPYWFIQSPNGAANAQAALSATPVVLDLVAGRYTLVATDTNNSVGSYSFKIQQNGTFAGAVVDRTVHTAVIGDVLSGTLAAGQEHRYDFTVTADTAFAMELLDDLPATMSWALEGVAGRVLASSSSNRYASYIAREDLAPGRYSVVIRGTNATVAPGAYRMRLRNSDAGQIPLVLGTDTTTSLDADHGLAVYSVNLQSGQRLVFDTLTQTGGANYDLTFRLFSADRMKSWDFTKGINDIATLVAPYDGTYLLEVNRSAYATAETSWNLSLSPVATQTVALDTPFIVDIDRPGRAIDAVFTLAQATTIQIGSPEIGTGNYYLRYDLIGPEGVIKASTAVDATMDVQRFVLPAGQYRLRLTRLYGGTAQSTLV
ncbi:LEPR-XLL domain-containing protein, partial [Pseudorhodobacter sp.]|uniref:LEPR-XLL domain-containing protein n=1 Tax=Pseudorhodobacter sp. TaxID=1934400 RepID=UPI002649F17B